MSNVSYILIENKLDELEKLNSQIENVGDTNKIEKKIINIFLIVVDELLSNIIFYGYEDKKSHRITISLSIDKEFMTLQIIYDGTDFDPRNAPEPDLTGNLEDRRIGGLGVHIVLKMTDYFDYKRKDTKSYITIKKKLKAINKKTTENGN